MTLLDQLQERIATAKPTFKWAEPTDIPFFEIIYATTNLDTHVGTFQLMAGDTINVSVNLDINNLHLHYIVQYLASKVEAVFVSYRTIIENKNQWSVISACQIYNDTGFPVVKWPENFATLITTDETTSAQEA